MKKLLLIFIMAFMCSSVAKADDEEKLHLDFRNI